VTHSHDGLTPRQRRRIGLRHAEQCNTPKRAARLEAKVLTDPSGETGVHFDEKGDPMLGSALVRDPKFQDRLVAEKRALLSTAPA
jgi:hypothetical protein